MTNRTVPGRDLLAFMTSAALGAVAATHTVNPVSSAAVVATLVTGLAINYASARLEPLLASASSREWSASNFDLDRVSEHALLTILYDTLLEIGISEKQAKRTVKEAGESWSLRIFREELPTESELVAALREPGPMPLDQAHALAHTILADQAVIGGGVLPAYARALSERFARTFEILLRGDERAFCAAVVYLQRLSLGDLKDLRSDLAAAVNFLGRPQPELQLYESQWKRDATPRNSDLQFKRRATMYRAREPIWTSLTEWLESPGAFRILKITGPAGMGKSRLALELCDYAHRSHWLAGFVTGDWPDPWIPNRNTLAVVDYAGSKSIAGRSGFDWLQSLFHRRAHPAQSAHGAGSNVRIVLLDRTDQGALWSDWKRSEVAGDLEELTLSINLDPDRAEFDMIVRDEFLRRTGRDLSLAEGRAVEAMAERLRGQFRPLFASLTAASLADPPPASTQAWSPELLLENMLKMQQMQWKTAAISDLDLDLLFESTLTQGGCGPDWEKRIESLTPDRLAALASLSEPDSLLGPVVPDLLGEFFILMRLSGQATTGARLPYINIRAANQIVASSWQNENAALFIGRLLEDYLGWTAKDKVPNPAIDLMRQALAQVENHRNSFGLRYCCFASAWKRPFDPDWPTWLNRLKTELAAGDTGAGQSVVSALATGFYNATVEESDATKCLALADRIQKLYNDHGHEPAVREQLAKALSNATVGEPDAAQRLALADRIETLHEDYGQEPAVREQLAQALFSATFVETDASKRLALADRIQKLHDKHGHEPAVREVLAQALSNATAVEKDVTKRLALADRIETLHEDYGQEPAVREQLARALFGATFVETDAAKCLALADRIQKLHDKHGHEPAVREALAQALLNASVVELDAAKCLALADRIETLHEDYGQEPAVREQLAQALFSATFVETDAAKCLALADRIETLHEDYGQEPAVRKVLAQALLNASVVELDATKRLALADRIQRLHDDYGHEPAVREHLAKALANAMVVEPEASKRLALADRIKKLHDDYGLEPAVWEVLAKVLKSLKS